MKIGKQDLQPLIGQRVGITTEENDHHSFLSGILDVLKDDYLILANYHGRNFIKYDIIVRVKAMPQKQRWSKWQR